MIDKKDHLLDVAEQLFAEHGFEGTTTRLLSKEAGINLAMVSYYFGSKEKLFEALVERKVDCFRDNIEPIVAQNSSHIEKLHAIIDTITEQFLSNPGFHRLVRREISLSQHTDMRDRIRKITATGRQHLSDFIQSGIDAGKFKQVDITLVIATLFGTLLHLINSNFWLPEIDQNRHIEPTKEAHNQTRVKQHLKNMLTAYLVVQ